MMMVALAATSGVVAVSMPKICDEQKIIELEPREYRFTVKDAKRMWLSPSNNTSGEKNVIFPIIDKNGVTIEGNGATLVFDGDVFPFAVLRSRGVTIRNLTITKPNPVVAALKVTETDEKGITAKFSPELLPAARRLFRSVPAAGTDTDGWGASCLKATAMRRSKTNG